MRVAGRGTNTELPATVVSYCSVEARVRLAVASAVPTTSIFDRVTGEQVGPLGVLEPLDLANLDELRLSGALVTGGYSRAREPDT